MVFWKRCDHEWHEVGRRVVIGMFESRHSKVTIYCPKCDKAKSVDELDWKEVERAQEIKAEYLISEKLAGR